MKKYDKKIVPTPCKNDKGRQNKLGGQIISLPPLDQFLNVAPASLSFHVFLVSYYLFLNAFNKDIFEPL